MDNGRTGNIWDDCRNVILFVLLVAVDSISWDILGAYPQMGRIIGIRRKHAL
jgi:hypothetical protein